MDIQKEIDQKLAECDAEIENRKRDLTVKLREIEDAADARVADKKVELAVLTDDVIEARRSLEHLHESRRRVEQDIATLKLTLPELRKELEEVQESNRKNLEDHQVRLTNLRVLVTEESDKLEALRKEGALLRAQNEQNKADDEKVYAAFAAEIDRLRSVRGQLQFEADASAKAAAEKTAELNAVIADCARAQTHHTELIEERVIVKGKVAEAKAELSVLELAVAAQKAALIDVEKERKRVAVYEQMVAERELAVKADAARLNTQKEALNKKEKDLAALGLQVK